MPEWFLIVCIFGAITTVIYIALAHPAEASVDMRTDHEQGENCPASTNLAGITSVEMLVALFMIATMSSEAFGAGAPLRPPGIPLTASEKRLFLKCEKIARAKGYGSVAYTSRCRALRPLGTRLLIEKL